MYSDGESDDFDSENATCTPAKTISRPYLRVFDEDEVESTMCQIWRKRTVKDGEISEDINPPYHKFYRILRFFRSYEGFYTVSSTHYSVQDYLEVAYLKLTSRGHWI